MNNSCENNPSCQNNDMMEKIQKTVSESGDLITALEHVGTMYGIPASNIITDDTAKSIRVVDDNIIAPSKPALGNTKAIVCAIGAVLDYISQRVDDKLTDFQMKNIDNGNVKIPIVDNNVEDNGYSYFSEDENDISRDIDMNASPDVTYGTVDIPEVNVSEEIQESAIHINMISQHNNTTHLGYDLFNSLGFDYVKPVDSFVQESVLSKKKKSKGIKPSDIKHLKFDNKGILDAIKYFNKAIQNQEYSEGKFIDKSKFVNDPNYEKAISSLNKQFDCRINLRFIDIDPVKTAGPNAFTIIFPEVKKNIYVSKSKGFQLGGLPIDVVILNDMLEASTPNEIKLFGQSVVSTILHEIFHNILFAMRFESIKTEISMGMTLNIASNCKNMKERRVILTNYVNSIDGGKNNILSKIAKKKLIKQLMVMTSAGNSKEGLDVIKAVREGDEITDEYVSNLIKKYKKVIKNNSPYSWKDYLTTLIISTASLILGHFSVVPFFSVFLMHFAFFNTLIMIMHDGIIALNRHKNDKQLNYEEYYCDLFAGMYQLPVMFFIGYGSNKKYTANSINQTKLNELASVEKEAFKVLGINYPSNTERIYAGVKIAKKLLDTEGLDPSTVQYCKWIVDNFSNIQKTDINEISSDKTFDPKEAQNLDRHLEKLIKDNNIVLTESFKKWLYSDEIIFNE